MAGTWLTRAASGSETGRSMLDVDWAATPLGAISTWPEALRSAVELCLRSQFPLMLVWGPDLQMIYNDGYRAMIGGKHPAALGAPARDVWHEIWHVVGPLFEQVLTTGEATWCQDQRLEIERNGFVEETYFTYSYSPIRLGDGVGGVLDIASETTARVVTERRLELAAHLAAELTGCTDVHEVRTRAVRALAVEPDEVGSAMLSPVRSAPQAGVEVVDPGWVAGRPATHVRIAVGGGPQAHVLDLGLSPNRPFDDSASRFVQLLATTIGSAMDAAVRRQLELDAEQEISTSIQMAMLELASDMPLVAARYVPATKQLAVGGDWYDVIDRNDGRHALVVGDCVGHGLGAAIAMGQLRSAGRGLLLAGAEPADVLMALDRFAATIPGGYMATVACLLIDLDAGTLDYALAGHPPPLLVGVDGARWLGERRGMPLALSGGPRLSTTVPVGPGDTIVAYTDGLVERRDEHIDVGLARLAGAATALARQPVQVIADALLELVGPDPFDDVALVVKRIPPAPGRGH